MSRIRPRSSADAIERLERRLLFALFGLDKSFGNGGEADVNGDWAVVVQPDGKILTIGFGPASEMFFSQTSLWRLNADGTLDTSFGGGDGRVDFAPELETYGAKFNGSRIYLSAAGGLEGDEIHAYTPDGALDTTFADDGRDLVSAYEWMDDGTDEFASVLALDPTPDGGVLLQISADPREQIVKLTADGSIDDAFGDNGYILSPPNSAGFGGHREIAVTVTSRGILIFVPALGLARYTFTGQLDTNFGGGDGAIQLPYEADYVAEQPDGKLLISNSAHLDLPGSPPEGERRLFRYNVDGSPDTAFGDNGSALLTHDVPGDFNEVSAIAVDAQQRIVVNAGGTLYRLSPAGVMEPAPFNGGLRRPDGSSLFGRLITFDAGGRILLGAGRVTRLAEIAPVEIGRDGVLYITGTDPADDVVTVDEADGDIRVTLNGVVTQHDADGVVGLALHLEDGDNRAAVSLDLPTTVNSGGGADSITTAGGDDTITSDPPGDTPDSTPAGSAGDTIASGAGSDTVRAGGGDNVFDLGAGNDDLNIFNPPSEIGQAAHNTITGGDGNKKIEALYGRITVTLGTGDSTIIAPQAGSSRITIAGGSNSVDLHADDDVLVIGGSGDNKVTVGGDGNDVTTGDGNDAFRISRGSTVRGGGGDDFFDVGSNFGDLPMLIFAGAGDDRVRVDNSLASEHPPVVAHGGDGNDSMQGSHGSQAFYGGAGKDTLRGGFGSDLLSGGGGHDLLAGEQGKDRLYGGTHDDTIHGHAGDDRIFGHDGRDHLYGGAGDDQLHGGAQGDRLFAQSGDDQLSGDGGNDRLYADYAAGTATLSGGAGDDILISRDALVDHLFGGRGDDACVADDEDDVVAGVESQLP